MYCLPKYMLNRLHCLQYYAAKTITLNWKYDHVIPILESLHWLPVQYRISNCNTHINKLTISAMRVQISPSPIQKTRTRSPSKTLLQVPITKCSSFENHVFFCCGPCEWNYISEEIKLCGIV